MASDSEEIEYMALRTAPFRPTAKQRVNEDADEDGESEIFLHEEEGFLVHMSHDDNKSQWNHVDDLDKFFTSVYDYHQRHGFQNMVLMEVLQLLQFVFIVVFATYLGYCVNYPELFDEVPHQNESYKKTLSDITYPIGECTAKISFFSWLLLFLCFLFFVGRTIKMAVNFCNYLRTRNFFISALNTETSDLSNMTWHEVQIRLLEVQKEQQICIHKQELTELDIYHRILRFKNYLVAMVNKELIPLKFQLPLIGEHALLTHGMRFNLDILLYWSPWSIFVNSYTMREDYKSHAKRRQLSDQLSTHIALLALLNLVLSPFIFFYQIIYFFFRYAEFVKRSPSFLGSRQWANYGRLYLRHFNELDHELMARLNRAYIPSTMYMKSFTSASLIIVAKYLAFFAGAPAAVLFLLGILDFNDVTRVEHLFTIASLCGMIATVCTGLIPDENEVFCPERLMMSILAQIHYMPSHWKGKAHTSNVRDEFSMLFQYKVVYILEELLSPLLTPVWLLFCLRPKSGQIVDFFRCFTVEVAGVGDVCSFAQMDIKKHGNHQWTATTDSPTEQKVPKASQGENGKIELSLMHFTSTNPEWRPPKESSHFVAGVKQEVQKELPALTSIIADPISLPSLGYVNPIPSFYHMGTSQLQGSYIQAGDQFTASPTVAPTSPGLISQTGPCLKGGLSSMDAPVVNTQSVAGGMTASSLLSNTGSFYSTDFNSLNVVDESQREMLSGNMSLSVLHLYETRYRRGINGGGAGGVGSSTAVGTTARGVASSVRAGGGQGYSSLQDVAHPMSGQAFTHHHEEQETGGAIGGVSEGAPGTTTQAKQPLLSSSSSSSSNAFGPLSMGYQTLMGSSSEGASPYTSSTEGMGVYGGAQPQNLHAYPYSEASSLTTRPVPQEHRRLARLAHTPVTSATADSQSMLQDFHYGSTTPSSPDALHPLAQRFRPRDDSHDGSNVGEEVGNDGFTSLAQRASQSSTPRGGVQDVQRSPAVFQQPPSLSALPQIEEDMSGEQEIDTTNLRP